MYNSEIRLIFFPSQKDRRFEYSMRKGFFKQTAEGKAYCCSDNVLQVKIRIVPGRNRTPCLNVDQHKLISGSFQHFPSHSSTAHKQEDARTELICNADQKEIPG